MKKLTMEELRQELAKQDAEILIQNIDDISNIVLYGFQGYYKELPENILEWYINKGNFTDFELEDSDSPIQVALVTDTATGKEYKVMQFCQEVNFEEVVKSENISK